MILVYVRCRQADEDSKFLLRTCQLRKYRMSLKMSQEQT